MRNIGTFETSMTTIQFAARGKTAYLVPFGDVHFGAPMFAEEVFSEFCSTYKARKDACHFIGMGDYFEMLSASERKGLEHALHESTHEIIDGLILDNVRKFAKKIEWMKGRLLGLHAGNHDYVFDDGQSASQKLAHMLDAKYLGMSAVSRVLCVCHGAQCTLDVFSHHGKGGGQLVGSPFNSLEKLALGFEADIYLNGHDHSLGALPATRLRPYWDRRNKELDVKERRILYVRTGSFLKGYVTHKGGYIAAKAKNPKPLGVTEIEITFVRKDATAAREKEESYLKLRAIA